MTAAMRVLETINVAAKSISIPSLFGCPLSATFVSILVSKGCASLLVHGSIETVRANQLFFLCEVNVWVMKEALC
jgi:hypothetical protein